LGAVSISGAEVQALARAASALERAIVAAALKARYLLPAYPPLPPGTQASELANDMHAAMRARIARLFTAEA
jgi:hypothetical protein